jgi:3-dehydroquinate synthase II
MDLEIFLKAVPWEKPLATLGLESGVDGLLVDTEDADQVKQLGRTQVLTPEDLACHELQDKQGEELAAQDLAAGKQVLLQKGWEVIPVENLLAVQKGQLGLEVESLEQARLAAGILEKGVDFLVLLPQARAQVKQIVQELKLSQGKLELEPARITSIQQAGLGHRVCVDTCSLLRTGQGLLTGNSSSFSFLVHAETEENPYVAARPFRINAGGVHAYVQKPGDRTSYLEELRAGDQILIVDHSGQTSLATVGRIKVEVRPMLLISAQGESSSGQIFLQNAETIRLVVPGGSPVSVVDLQKGDEVLCRTDVAGRHFGMRIQENIEEK